MRGLIKGVVKKLWKLFLTLGSICLFTALGTYNFGKMFFVNSNVYNAYKCIDLEEFDSIQMDVDTVNINIQESDKFRIEYNLLLSSPHDEIICKNEDRTLIFKSKNNNSEKNWIKNSKDQYINIFVSPYKKLNNCEINVNVGKLNCSDKIVMGDNLNIKCDVGSINILNCNSENTNIESGVGNVKISGNLYGKSLISVDVGNVNLNLSKTLLDYSYLLKSGVGKIFLYGKKQKSNYGESKLESKYSNDSNLKVTVGVGKIDISKLKT